MLWFDLMCTQAFTEIIYFLKLILKSHFEFCIDWFTLYFQMVFYNEIIIIAIFNFSFCVCL